MRYQKVMISMIYHRGDPSTGVLNSVPDSDSGPSVLGRHEDRCNSVGTILSWLLS